MVVIGDVHGMYDLLLELLDKLPQTDDICFVGDLIDRGGKSKQVLELVKTNGYKSVLGNHEHMAINDRRLWLVNGGDITFKEFGNKWPSSEWGEWVTWFKTFPLYIEWTRYDGKKFIISHSFAHNGVNTRKYDLLWDRDWVNEYEEDDIDMGFCNIFGHTPNIHPVHLFNRHWCIDTGAYITDILTAIDLETETLYWTKHA